MRHRIHSFVGAAVIAAALCACESQTVVTPELQASAMGSPRGLSLGADTTITVGDTVRFKVINPGGNPVPSPAIRWASSEPLVASVLPDGTIETLKPGGAVLTAQLGSWSLARNVTVSLPGGRIVFRSGTSQSGLYGVRPDGTGRFQIAAPSWAAYSDVSPDGRWIVYSGNMNNLVNGQWLTRVLVGMQPVGGSETRIIFDQPGIADGVSWSPVEGRIVFAAGVSGRGGRQLYVTDTAVGASVTQIATFPVQAMFPAWSPDGTRIAFNTDGTGLADRDIWIVNADGSNLVRVTGAGAWEQHPAWISNSRLVISRRIGNAPTDLYLVNIDGTGLVQLTDQENAMWPRPSPDRRWVVFWRGSSLSIVRVDGGLPFGIPTQASGGNLFPSWGPEP